MSQARYFVFISMICFLAPFAKGDKFYLIEGRWDPYIQEPPVLLVGSFPSEIVEIVKEGEVILVNLFDAESLEIDELVEERFANEIAALQQGTPETVTSEGYRTRRQAYGYVSSDYTVNIGRYYTITSDEIQPNSSGSVYDLPSDAFEKDIVIQCKVSDRTLFFTTGKGIGQSIHPLQLIRIEEEAKPREDPFDG